MEQLHSKEWGRGGVEFKLNCVKINMCKKPIVLYSMLRKEYSKADKQTDEPLNWLTGEKSYPCLWLANQMWAKPVFVLSIPSIHQRSLGSFLPPPLKLTCEDISYFFLLANIAIPRKLAPFPLLLWSQWINDISEKVSNAEPQMPLMS